MVNILVTGANGQLGSEIREIARNYQGYNFLFTDVEDLDITIHSAVKKYVESNRINVIINCAAYTAVEKAESEPEIANKINHLAVNNFAKLSKENRIKLIHISTDYVFDGTNDKPYTETDKPNPLTVYGKTKLYGELAVQQINPANSIIIRTSWVYSKFGNNFVKTMFRLAKNNDQISVVSDQIGSPTNAADLAKMILKIISKISNETVELFHYSNEGFCSWFEFAKVIFKGRNLDLYLESISSNDFPSVAPRPNYSALNCEKIKKRFGFSILDWKTSFNKIDFSSLAVEA